MERSLIATLVLGTVALFGTVAAKAAPQYDDRYYGGGQVVRCDSNDNRYRECRLDTRGGVQMVRQVSKTRCEEGRTWGRTARWRLGRSRLPRRVRQRPRWRLGQCAAHPLRVDRWAFAQLSGQRSWRRASGPPILQGPVQ